MEVNKLKIGKPEFKIERSDVITILITTVLTGIIIGLVAYTFTTSTYAILYGVSGGLILGFIANFSKNRILSGVTYPSLKTLLELTVYILIVGAVVAVISLGLDLMFLRVRDALL